MTALAALAAGFAAGVLGVALLWRHLVEARAVRALERLRADGDREAVLRAVDAERAGIKAQLGTELTPLLPAFPFEPADTRFLGHPAHFVVFAGHTEVKDRRQRELAEVVFVTLRSGGSDPSDARLVDECVRAGRVRWATLRVDAAQPGVDAAQPGVDVAQRGVDAPQSDGRAPTALARAKAAGRAEPAELEEAPSVAALRDGRRR